MSLASMPDRLDGMHRQAVTLTSVAMVTEKSAFTSAAICADSRVNISDFDIFLRQTLADFSDSVWSFHQLFCCELRKIGI